MEPIRQVFRTGIRHVAVVIDRWSGGRAHPDAVTIIGCLAHAPIALLIATGSYIWAAVLLAIFGLFDTLDGQLAQVQKRQSARGMLLDAVTDRIKEILLYIGVAYSIIATTGRPYLAVWAVAACGCSLLTSYLNAFGDVVMTHAGVKHTANKALRGGLLPFEVRMAVLIVGLLSGRLTLAVIVIALGAAYTALSRLVRVARALAQAHV
ncbi:MAG TPA: CDP-alcohol phosphatidyltransferase family protein [Candidatus Saccharimonadales bacterium]|nr:CDP-alcohol phosphatidyltransferase family protein [Candidatus Saccharimonadales bacterium]